MTENDDCFIICVPLFSAINDLITLNNGYVLDQLFINFNMSHSQMLGKFEYTLPAKF